MSKTTKIIIAVLIVIAIAAIIVVAVLNSSKSKTNLPEIKSSDDLATLIGKVYEGVEVVPNSVETQKIDVTDSTLVQSFTGLENGNNLEYLAVSEPMINARAYSFVLLKVKAGVNSDKIAEEVKEKVDQRKWICVSAEKVYTTSSGNVVCLVMSDEETAKPIYESFKKLAGTVGKEYVKTEEEIQLPPEMN